MAIGKLYLSSISRGIVTPSELRWVACNQLNFSKCEQAIALKLGKLVDSGQIQIGLSYNQISKPFD